MCSFFSRWHFSQYSIPIFERGKKSFFSFHFRPILWHFKLACIHNTAPLLEDKCNVSLAKNSLEKNGGGRKKSSWLLSWGFLFSFFPFSLSDGKKSPAKLLFWARDFFFLQKEGVLSTEKQHARLFFFCTIFLGKGKISGDKEAKGRNLSRISTEKLTEKLLKILKFETCNFPTHFCTFPSATIFLKMGRNGYLTKEDFKKLENSNNPRAFLRRTFARLKNCNGRRKKEHDSDCKNVHG